MSASEKDQTREVSYTPLIPAPVEYETKRQRYARIAMEKIIDKLTCTEFSHCTGDEIAKSAFQMADSMLQYEREHPEKDS